MKKEKMTSLIDVHICNYSRENGEDCATKGAKEITDELKKWSKENFKGEVKVFRGGCQGKCSEGISVACYPERSFFLNVTPMDTDEIKKGLIEALRDAKK